MEKEELNNRLLRYMQLCEAFKDSDIWSDEAKQAIKLYNAGDSLIKSQCEVIAFYELIWDACELLGRIRDGEVVDYEIYECLSYVSREIFEAYDDAYVIRSVYTENKPFKVNMRVADHLIKQYGFANDVVINRDFFLDVTDKVAVELERLMKNEI